MPWFIIFFHRFLGRAAPGAKSYHFLSKTSEVKPPPLEISVDKLKSAVARYEYHLTFPLILSEDKDSLVSPQRGVGRYCRSVFGIDQENGSISNFV